MGPDSRGRFRLVGTRAPLVQGSVCLRNSRPRPCESRSHLSGTPSCVWRLLYGSVALGGPARGCLQSDRLAPSGQARGDWPHPWRQPPYVRLRELYQKILCICYPTAASSAPQRTLIFPNHSLSESRRVKVYLPYCLSTFDSTLAILNRNWGR